MRRLWAFVVAALVAGTVASSAAPEVSARSSGLRWRDCHEEAGPDFECATFAVPLDHDKPSGKKVSLCNWCASPPPIRRTSRARSSSIRVGPAGRASSSCWPSGRSSTATRCGRPSTWSASTREASSSSEPLLCFDTLRRGARRAVAVRLPDDQGRGASGEAARQAARPGVQEARWGDRGPHGNGRRGPRPRPAAARGRRSPAELRRLLVRVVPRRHLRQPVPRTGCGALVVDGVLDPIAWTTGRSRLERKTLPFSTRLRSDAGAQATLDEFFRLCDEAGPDGCAFAPDAADRFAALAERLRAEPIELIDPETGEVFLVGYADLIGESLGAMYNSFDWPFFAELLAFVESVADPAAAIGAPPRPTHGCGRDLGASLRRERESTRTSSRASPASPARTASTRTTTAAGRRPAQRPTSSSATSVGSGRGRRACAPTWKRIRPRPLPRSVRR